jgi:hypothetical protein
MAPRATVNELLTELRDVIDQRERLSTQDSALSKRKSYLEHELLAVHESEGVDSVSGAGMTVSFDDAAMRVKYDPEKWAGICRWAIETGNDHIIQRRLTDAKVMDLIENGTALPEGLTVENYVKISTRRKG